MSGCPRVWRFVEEAKAQLDRVRFPSLEDPAWLATIHRQHEEIVDRVVAATPRARWRRCRATCAPCSPRSRPSPRQPRVLRRAPILPVDRAAPDES
jgi:hypothetical protein